MIFGLGPGTGFEVHTEADLDRYLAAVAAAGFDGVEFGVQVAGVIPPERVAQRFVAHGVRCIELMGLRVTRDDATVIAQASALRPLVEALDATFILTSFGTRPSEESIDRIGRMADAAGCRLALEYVAPICPTLDVASQVVAGVGAERAGILIDTFHFTRGGSTYEMLDRVPLDHVAIVQFNDAPEPLSDDYYDETMNRRVWPGEGVFELERFAAILRTRGWDGVVSVEVLNAALRQLPVEEFAGRAFDTTTRFWT